MRMLKFQSNAKFVQIGLFGVGSTVDLFYEFSLRSVEFGKFQIFDKFSILFYAVNAFVLDK